MVGAHHTTIFKFIDHLKSEESLSVKKIVQCEAGRSPTKQRQKTTIRDNAIKNSVLNYQKVSKDFRSNSKISQSDQICNHFVIFFIAIT